jgi:hypothetical protein
VLGIARGQEGARLGLNIKDSLVVTYEGALDGDQWLRNDRVAKLARVGIYFGASWTSHRVISYECFCTLGDEAARMPPWVGPWDVDHERVPAQVRRA